MKKKLFAMFFTLILCITMVVPAFAAESMPRVVDNANLLQGSQKDTLIKKLDEISKRQGMDVVVVTEKSIGGKTPREFADDFYDNNGYTKDGILLLVSMENRDWWMSTKGEGITAFTDAGVKHISSKFLNDLSEEKYAEAFTIFADKCDEFITQAHTGKPYDTGNLPKDPYKPIKSLMISVAIGLVLSLIITSVMKGKLKTVRRKSEATNYVVQGSMNITRNNEMFLYSHVDRVEKQEQSSSSGSSTHKSSSGSTHGGSGGKF